MVGFQLVACVGSLMAGLSMVAAVFFKDITGMIIFYGVFSGELNSIYFYSLIKMVMNFLYKKVIKTSLMSNIERKN